jgi:hypothetical protein
VAELIRRGLAQEPAVAGKTSKAGLRIDPGTGLPLIRSPRPVTAEDVRALEDD